MLRVNYSRLATGIVFLALFLGFELHIAAIQNLLPGTYAGLTTGNYLGFAFLISALGALGSAFSSTPSYPVAPTAASPPSAAVDPYAVAAAMMALQQGQAARPASAPGSMTPPSTLPAQPATVACPACGATNLTGARFCQGCGKTFGAAAAT